MSCRQPYAVWPPGWEEAKADFDRLKISESLLHLVKELYVCFPDHCTPSRAKWLTENLQDAEHLFDWIKAQGIVVGDLSHCALTLSGRQAFRAALQELPDPATRLMATDAELEQGEAAKLWLETLRKHFENARHRT